MQQNIEPCKNMSKMYWEYFQHTYIQKLFFFDAFVRTVSINTTPHNGFFLITHFHIKSMISATSIVLQTKHNFKGGINLTAWEL